MNKKPTIAIDGPAGSGKTTVARAVARRLGLVCIETGAMYRAVAWQAQHDGVAAEEASALAAMVAGMDLRVEPGADERTHVRVAGRDITAELRTPAVEQLASRISTHAEVRRALVEMQRRLARGGGVVMEGRDIQTVVLPDADVKVFLTASVEARARRRLKDLAAAALAGDFEEVRRQIAERDRRDETRDASPLRPAADALILDTDHLTADEVVARVAGLVETRGRG